MPLECIARLRCLLHPFLMSGWCVVGDTCQTIARGIGFRFADLRTLFFEESQRRKVCIRSGIDKPFYVLAQRLYWHEASGLPTALGDPEDIALQAIGGVHNAMPVAVPALEHLKINYRTHSGIMNVGGLGVSSAWRNMKPGVCDVAVAASRSSVVHKAELHILRILIQGRQCDVMLT